MAVKRIIKYPDPLLRQPAKEVKEINGQIHKVVKNMLDTMNQYNHSVGIAAIQIGAPYSIICVDASKSRKIKGKTHGQLILINPEVVEAEGEITTREGCLSVPEFVGYVTRSRKILVRAITLKEKEVEIETVGLEAVILQHEIDHLKGILFIDRITSPSMLMLRKELQKR